MDLWSGYLRQANTSVSDYLSVEHLGRILAELALGECAVFHIIYLHDYILLFGYIYVCYN